MLPSVQKKILIIHSVTGQNIIVLLYSVNKTSNVILILSLLSLINFQIYVLSSDFLAKVIYFLIFPMRSTYPTALLLIESSSRLQTLVAMTLAVFVDLCLWTAETVFEIIRLQAAFQASLYARPFHLEQTVGHFAWTQ
jgi:hypothetical protein